jgi:hypothetical protein
MMVGQKKKPYRPTSVSPECIDLEAIEMKKTKIEKRPAAENTPTLRETLAGLYEKWMAHECLSMSVVDETCSELIKPFEGRVLLISSGLLQILERLTMEANGVELMEYIGRSRVSKTVQRFYNEWKDPWLMLIIPVYLNAHWSLLIVDRGSTSGFVFDSLAPKAPSDQNSRPKREKLDFPHAERSYALFTWTITSGLLPTSRMQPILRVYEGDAIRQTDGHSCGYFVIACVFILVIQNHDLPPDKVARLSLSAVDTNLSATGQTLLPYFMRFCAGEDIDLTVFER